MNKNELHEKCQNIKAFLFDIDGVLSDGKVIYDNNLVEHKNFNIKDGWAIVLLKKLGFTTGIITGRHSSIVGHRAHELKVDYVIQGKLEKLEYYEEFKQLFGFDDSEVAYIGDDLIDLPILIRCGFSGAPSNCVEEVRERVDFLSTYPGGHGAAREFIELVLKSKGVWDEVVEHYTKV
jgi:3-deoxy-D-manno-octulosonate 8-phosphate phosphatase (KDO 8-P phosphatase)